MTNFCSTDVCVFLHDNTTLFSFDDLWYNLKSSFFLSFGQIILALNINIKFKSQLLVIKEAKLFDRICIE